MALLVAFLVVLLVASLVAVLVASLSGRGMQVLGLLALLVT
jgi:hypothetical protein